MTGTTTVTREPEWDDYTRSRALALIAWESNRCPRCRSYDSLVPLPSDTRDVTWDQHDGRVFEVLQYRCLACASADLVQRDWNARHENDKPVTGQFLPADGRMFIAHPKVEEV